MISVESGYAQALLEAALARDSLKRVMEELALIDVLLSTQRSYFLNPKVSPQAQINTLRSALVGNVDILTVQFVCLLAERLNLRALPAIRAHFEILAHNALGDAAVFLRIPYPPSDSTLSEIREYLLSMGMLPPEEKDSRLNIVIDRSLIGGFVAEYDGRVIDASVRTKLKNAYLPRKQGD